MIYRKATAVRPTLLLRIVATAGAGALLGMAACTSGDSCHHGLCASGDSTPDDAAVDDATVACASGACGLTANPSDASGAPTGLIDAGTDSAAVVDAGGDADVSDADGPCPLVCGSVVAPPDGGDAGPSCFHRCDVLGIFAPPQHS